MRSLSIALLLFATGMVAGCRGLDAPSQAGPSPIALRTQEPIGSETPPGCPAALIEGVLVTDEASGVALRDPSDGVVAIIWPNGFSGRAGTPIAVVDASGKVIARVGDTVQIGGGAIGADGAWMACGGISVLEPVAS